jgi:phosphotransacetylase
LIPTFRDRIKAHGEKLSSAELLKSNEELGKKLIKINDLSTSLAIIIGEKNELKRNQEELGLEVTDFEDIDTYENNFKNIESLYEEKKRWTHFL